MATLFPSFRSSSMPKRLLRYALAKLELLDAETLDMENLDLAIGMNSVFEFRDVGVKLKKLEKLLKLPSTLRLQKAKVILLRITIPVDFYTSPITVDVEGVDVKLQVLGPDRRPATPSTASTPNDPSLVPNKTDLAQSFLETQPLSERKELEQALAAETQDLGASVSMSDDGSSEEDFVGTGQPLSLPSFLADFLQGIVDRMQVNIRNVTFQMDVDVPVDPTTSAPEILSFQVALESIDVEGVTTQGREPDDETKIVPKEGKRHISLRKVRAYLISEASVFSAMAQSPSTTSPSLASSPALTRNPPTRESSLTEGDQTNLHTAAAEALSSRQTPLGIVPDDDSSDPEEPLRDSEDALAIPYDIPEDEDSQYDNDGPATPRASTYQGFDGSPGQSMFHSTMLPDDTVADSAVFEHDLPLWASAQSGSASESASGSVDLTQSQSSSSRSVEAREAGLLFSAASDTDDSSDDRGDGRSDDATEDLAESHLYSHEEAESMYMSALSNRSTDNHAEQPSRPEEAATNTESSEAPTEPEPEPEPLVDSPERLHSAMPGGWGEESELPASRLTPPGTSTQLEDRNQESPVGEAGNGRGTPMPEPSAGAPHHDPEPEPAKTQDPEPEDAATPKGPTRLVKEFLTLDTISIHVPSQHKHIQVQAESAESVSNLAQSLGHSVYPQAPGAFSVHGAAPSVTPRSPSSSRPAGGDEGDGGDDAIEIDLSPISVRFDASLGFLLAIVAARLVEALAPKPEAAGQQQRESQQRESQGQAPKTTGQASDIRLTLQKMSVDFVNQLGGVADTAERHMDRSVFNFDNDVLLNATLQNLTAVTHTSARAPKANTRGPDPAPSTLTRIELDKFRFGYASDDIVSFDSGRPMSTSVRDTFLTSGRDIGINIVQSGGHMRTDIETLPLAVQVDLQRLDETFSWFGGLSSFLSMSTSMASVHSPVVKQTHSTRPRPRSVRFEAPLEPDNKTAASESKVNLRIGGSWIELQGKDCSISMESSAIKLVSRDEGVGAAISFLRLSGPHIRNSMADPAITTDITGVRMDYLTTPKDVDLERLLELITPSSAKFDQENDGIMVDTLLKQRRKGSVLRVGVESVAARVKNIGQLGILPAFGDEIAKLSTVAKYLPEDDRPGLLTLGKVQKITAQIDCGGKIGQFDATVEQMEAGHITIPSLIAVSTHGLFLKRNGDEELIRSSPSPPSQGAERIPILTARMIGEEMEPVTKVKLQNVTVEYRVPFVMDILGLAQDTTPQEFEASLSASVASLGEQAQAALRQQMPRREAERSKATKPMTLDVGFKDCIIGLNPLTLPSKMDVCLTDARLQVVLPQDVETKAVLSVNKASILLIDDVGQITPVGSRAKTRIRSSSTASDQVANLCAQGFVDICYISSAKVVVSVDPGPAGEKQVNVDLRDDLLVLETCADSTQTLITLANALKPPTPPTKEIKYRTNVMPVQDLLASISAEAFGKAEGEYDFDQDFAVAQEMAGSGSELSLGSDGSLAIESGYYAQQEPDGEEMFDAMKVSGISHGTTMQDTDEGVLLSSTNPALDPEAEDSGSSLDIHESFYASDETGGHQTAKTWNSRRNSYDRAPESLVKHSPLKVTLRDSHVIWHLFDGYDWVRTRDVISNAVGDIESRAMERQSRGEGANVYEEDMEDEETIGDFLFNSIYIGVAANRDPGELARAINQDLNDNATETESLATTSYTGGSNRTVRQHQPKPQRRLRLNRSKHHKITFELHGVNADVFAFPAGMSNTESSIDVRVDDVDIFDHVPTSTWRKFATYDRDAGEREMGAPMVHLELLNVKPISDLPVSEIVLRATVLPLRLHVDQDALDFITRFFEFKDENVPVHASPSDVPFVQRAEVMSIPVKLDFKPKRVDYAGLRSGHTSEFMNFIVLEEANMVLRHAIIYGISGFDRLGKTLNDLWTPDVTRNQLPGVMAGLAPVRSLVTIGSGFKDLIEIPIREYRKDGRAIRSISKGAAAFARTTGTEIIKLGAKLAVGTQYALQGAEDMLTEQQQQRHHQHRQQMEGSWDEDDFEPEEKKQISLYADPPPSVMQGLRGGYRSLARDVNLARDAIIAVPGEVMQSQSPGGAAKALWKRAPTIVFRPAVGVTKAVGQTLMGATSSVDPHHRRRVDEKYKKH